MPRDRAPRDEPFVAAMRQLAESLIATYGPAARERALTIAAAIAIQGNDELASVWEQISRLLGEDSGRAEYAAAA